MNSASVRSACLIPITMLAAASIASCTRPHVRNTLPPGPPLSIEEAVAVVNQNSAKIHDTLRAIGAVDGHFRSEKGRRVSYHVDGTLFYLPPQYLRFDLKKLGNREFLFGSNDREYWAYSNAEDEYYCHKHGTEESLPSGSAIQAAQVIEALGLTPIPAADAPGNGIADKSEPPKVAQQITGDMQMIRVARESITPARIYWLDRRPPRLIRRLEILDRNGKVIMESRLDDYEEAYAGGPLVPLLIEVRWPADAADLRFQVSKWTTVNEVTNSSPQFATPTECRSANP